MRALHVSPGSAAKQIRPQSQACAMSRMHRFIDAGAQPRRRADWLRRLVCTWRARSSRALHARSRSAALLRRVTTRQFPAAPREVAGVAVRDPLEVVLMLGLGLPEIADRLDLGDHLARPQARSIDVGDGLLGDPLLRLVDVVDRRAVGRADVVALPVLGRRVVDLEEELQQVAIARLRRDRTRSRCPRRGCRGCDRWRWARRRRCSRRGS